MGRDLSRDVAEHVYVQNLMELGDVLGESQQIAANIAPQSHRNRPASLEGSTLIKEKYYKTRYSEGLDFAIKFIKKLPVYMIFEFQLVKTPTDVCLPDFRP